MLKQLWTQHASTHRPMLHLFEYPKQTDHQVPAVQAQPEEHQAYQGELPPAQLPDQRRVRDPVVGERVLRWRQLVPPVGRRDGRALERGCEVVVEAEG
jgi:hypothetical protein